MSILNPYLRPTKANYFDTTYFGLALIDGTRAGTKFDIML